MLPLRHRFDIFSPAKINLFLHLVHQRTDGYHELQTAFALLQWGDALTLEIDHSADKKLSINGMDSVPLTNNLMYKAVKRYEQASKLVLPPLSISIKKQIPMGGGLGGGSSNAASILLALNDHFTPLPQSVLLEIGLELGADVPVFLRQSHSWAEGIGEQLFPITLQPCFVLLALPQVAVNTAKAFQSSELERQHEPLRRTEHLSLNHFHHNHFESVVRKLYPEVDQCFLWLAKVGRPQLSGSGSSVFALFETQEQALHAQRQLRELNQGSLPFALVQTAIQH